MVLPEVVGASSEALYGLTPIIDAVKPLVVKVTLLLGGIAGVYAILLLARIHYERKKVKILEHIRYDLDNLNIHYGVPHSRQKIGFWHRIFDFFFPRHILKHKYDPATSNLYEEKKKRP